MRRAAKSVRRCQSRRGRNVLGYSRTIREAPGARVGHALISLPGPIDRNGWNAMQPMARRIGFPGIERTSAAHLPYGAGFQEVRVNKDDDCTWPRRLAVEVWSRILDLDLDAKGQLPACMFPQVASKCCFLEQAKADPPPALVPRLRSSRAVRVEGDVRARVAASSQICLPNKGVHSEKATLHCRGDACNRRALFGAGSN